MKPTTLQKIFYSKIITPFRVVYLGIRYQYRKRIGSKNLSKSISSWYSFKTHRSIDIENPVTFTQKIQWLKLHQSTPLKGRLADKYEVRSWIAEKIGNEYLIPIYGVWDDPHEIDFDKLPDCFVLKATHGSGMNIIVEDKKLLDRKNAYREMNKWIKTSAEYMSAYDMHYQYCSKRVIAEKFMGHDIKDYKFMMINGNIAFVWVDADRYTGHKRGVYDSDWNLLPFQLHTYPIYETEAPRNFEKMKELASVLASGFDVVRVDFYDIDGAVYFGEMTFTSSSGSELFYPEKWDKFYGDMLKLTNQI